MITVLGTRPKGPGAEAGFTLAEVIAALLFMAIVIPVAMQGLHVATLAGETAERKIQAARVAERLLNECLITTNYSKPVLNATTREGSREFRWNSRIEPWSADTGQNAPRLLTVEVLYPVQDLERSVRLSTLVAPPATL